jgi:hypothetical protein
VDGHSFEIALSSLSISHKRMQSVQGRIAWHIAGTNGLVPHVRRVVGRTA